MFIKPLSKLKLKIWKKQLQKHKVSADPTFTELLREFGQVEVIF